MKTVCMLLIIGPYQLSGKVYDQAPWFKAVVKNGFYISNVFLGYRQVPHFVIAVAKMNPRPPVGYPRHHRQPHF